MATNAADEPLAAPPPEPAKRPNAPAAEITAGFRLHFPCNITPSLEDKLTKAVETTWSRLPAFDRKELAAWWVNHGTPPSIFVEEVKHPQGKWAKAFTGYP